MRGLPLRRASLGAGLLALAGCTSPTEPDAYGVPPGTYQSELVAVVGTGSGGTSVTSVANASGGFAGTMRFRVRAKPNTTYLVQRAADLMRAGTDDGVCQRADGLPPWSPADLPFGPAFVTFPTPSAGPLVTFTTNGQGEGSLDYNFDTPQITRGTRFDVKMRLVDDENAPTSDLRSRLHDHRGQLRGTMRAAIAVLMLSLLALGPAASEGCGDKFQRVGRGARFQRGYMALHPACILLYARPQSPIAKALKDLEPALKRAGHLPLLVERPEGLGPGAPDRPLRRRDDRPRRGGDGRSAGAQGRRPGADGAPRAAPADARSEWPRSRRNTAAWSSPRASRSTCWPRSTG